MVEAESTEPTLAVPAGVLQRMLFTLLLVLTGAGLFAEVSKYVLFGERYWWGELLSMSFEKNLPTWYSAGLLFTCGMLLAAIGTLAWRTEGRRALYWCGMSLALFYVSLDEMISIHEYSGGWLHVGGFFYYDWIIGAAAVLLVLGVIYLKFLWNLPKETRKQFFLAAFIYVGGAMGVEMVLGYWTEIHGIHTLGYGLIDIVEESMEILGVSIFLIALVEYLGRRLGLEIDAVHHGSQAQRKVDRDLRAR